MSTFIINCRASSGFVTDGTDQTYSLGEVYPITRGGLTYGWNTDLTSSTRDRDSGLDPRLAGIVFVSNNTTLIVLRIDLPSTGGWDINLAAGDAGSDQLQNIALKDGGTAFFTSTLDTATNTATFMDATNVVYSAANWPGSNTALRHTFTSTTFTIELGIAAGSSGVSSTLASIGITDVAAAVAYPYDVLYFGSSL